MVASSLATLAQLFDGRAVLGLGRGDSAVRTLGLAPMALEEFRAALQLIRGLCRGEEVRLDGVPVRLTWLTRTVLVLVAAYGPRVLRLAGELADGVILQLASPGVIEWAVGHAASLERKVYPVPREIDEEIARLKLATMGVAIDELTEEQARYLASWDEGT